MNLKNERIKALSHKISVTYRILKKTKLLKQCQKEVIHEYILAFAQWWSIFWVVVDGGGYIVANGGCWWMVIGGGGWWWVVVGGGRV